MSNDWERHDGLDRYVANLGLALEATRPEDDCPSPELIAAWHDKALPAEEATRVRAHIARCDDCRLTWLALLETEQPSPRTSPVVEAGGFAGLLCSLRDLFGGRALAPAAAAVAVAAVAVTLVFSHGSSLPPYSLTVGGETQAVRSSDAAAEPEVFVFEPGNRFDLVLKPPDDYPDEIDVALFTRAADDGRLEALDPPGMRITGEGVARIEGTVGQGLALPTGSADLFVVVSRSGRMPEAAAVREALGAGYSVTRRHWNAWRLRITTEAPRPE